MHAACMKTSNKTNKAEDAACMKTSNKTNKAEDAACNENIEIKLIKPRMLHVMKTLRLQFITIIVNIIHNCAL